VQELFSDQIPGGLLPILLILKVAVIAACLGSGAPGGSFTPTITCGALLGGCLGLVWARFWPGAAPGSFAILGAGAVLAASAKSPVSTLVMLVELTQRLDSSMVPFVPALAGAVLVASALNPALSTPPACQRRPRAPPERLPARICNPRRDPRY
jgi:CIC family chloride channel protein